LSSGLAFFSEQKVTSLTQKIGNTRLQDIVKKLDDYIASRLGLTDEPIWPPINFDKPEQKDRPTPNETRSYIQGENGALLTSKMIHVVTSESVLHQSSSSIPLP
jgi:hypothetical protein